MINYSDAITCLIDAFPEICWSTEITDDIEGLPYMIYGCVFVPHIKKALLNKNNLQLERMFLYLEEMASSNDEEVKNLLQVGVLEALWDDSSIYKMMLDHLLPNTKRINEMIGYYFSLPK